MTPIHTQIHSKLSVSHVFHTFTSCSHVTLCIHAGIADLFEVKMKVKNVNDWQSLGLALGLIYPTLERIELEQRGIIDICMTKTLAGWLQQKDNVSQHGTPSWSVLQTALRNIGENELADTITTT